jgi:hypothetical protein
LDRIAGGEGAGDGAEGAEVGDVGAVNQPNMFKCGDVGGWEGGVIVCGKAVGC